MKCPMCHASELVDTKTRDSIKIGGRTFVVEDLPAEECPACGEVLIGAVPLMEFDREVARYLAEHGPINGETFSFIHSAFGITYDDLAPMLGVAQSTLSRWANGKRPVDRNAWFVLASLVLEPERTRRRMAVAQKPTGAKRLTIKLKAA